MLIKLTDHTDVAAEHIAEVSELANDRGVLVRMRDRIEHVVPNDYGKGSHATKRRLVDEINKALEG